MKRGGCFTVEWAFSRSSNELFTCRDSQKSVTERDAIVSVSDAIARSVIESVISSTKDFVSTVSAIERDQSGKTNGKQ